MSVRKSSISNKASHPYSPTYTYQQGTIYYFRYRFTSEEKKRLAVKEIRISLNTGYFAEAKRYARHLKGYLEDLLMSPKGQPSIDELRVSLHKRLQKLIADCPEKQPPSISEIKERMRTLLAQAIDQADATLFRPWGIISNENNKVEMSGKEYLDAVYQSFLKENTGNVESLISIYYPETIIKLLQSKTFNIKELTSESIIQILNEYHKLQISFNRIMAAREEGDFGFENNFRKAIYKEENFDKKQYNKNYEDILISELIEKYKTIKIADGRWSERNIATHLGRINTLIDILGDIPVKSIDREAMRSYREILRKLPPNRNKNKEYRDKSIQQILDMHPKKTLNIKTVNDTIESISSMFKWAINEYILDKNPATGLTLQDERQDIDLREAFTDEEITKIFFSGDFSQDRFPSPAFYWVPLIGLYTGMRLEEICQLYCNDIYKEDGIWIIDINENDESNDKKLKTKNAKRKIPIHDLLISLGLINYLQEIRNYSKRLFPELKKTEKTQKYSKPISKAFSKLLKAKAISNENNKKSFHSLRHTFSNFYKIRNMHNDIFRQIFGHEIQELAGRQYGSKFPVKQCYDELISKIHYSCEKNILKNI